MSKIHISFDLDWCPDFMIDEVLKILETSKVKCTFFITHSSPSLKKILNLNHNVGIHPNYLKFNSIKKNLKITEKILNVVPSAKLIRSHALHMNTNLLYEIFKNFPNIKMDLSTLTYKSKFIHKFNYDYIGKKINRINYNWEDSIGIHEKNFKWKTLKYFGVSNIYNFHPIHIFYNTHSYNHYLKIKKSSPKNLSDQKINDLNHNLIYEGEGVRTFFNKIIKSGIIENNLYKIL
jgi:hypothetical protein|tara:strand:+ start:61 stop:762 length:702 start_codon:yes stop_codon:yes gene_type:complete